LFRVNGFFAAYVAKILLYTPISANQLSFFMGVLAVIAGVLFAFGEFWYSILALFLIFFQENLDYIDGLIARYRGTSSMRGIFVDLLIHSITASLTFFGLAIGVFRNTGEIMFFIFGGLAAIFTVLASYIHPLKNQALIIKLKEYASGKRLEELDGKDFEVKSEVGKEESKFSLKSLVREGMVYLTFRYTTFVLIFSIIFDFTQWVLVFYGIFLPLKWFVLMMYEFKADYKSLEYLFKPYKK
tara:strand:+ start:62 stop:787 length:726 start_codon:yes stop_codon:yes gene_type:complete